MLEKICGTCFQSANFICMRCNAEYYCSKKCQVADFPIHRRECFSIPPLKKVNSEQILSETSNKLNSSTDLDNISIADLKKTEKIEIKTDVIPKEPPKVEDITKELLKKCEVKVTPAFNAGIHTIPPNDCKNAPPPKKTTDVEQQEKTQDAEKTEKQTFGLEPMRRNQQSALIMKPKDTRVYLKDLKVRSLAIGKVKVKIVGENECPKAFYVTESLPAVDAFLEHIEINILDCVKNEKLKSYKPVLNEVVLARFEDVYYRAVVEDIIMKDVNNTVFGVFFIDYGNVSQVTEDDLLPLSPKLKGEIILHPVIFENFPSSITKALEDIVINPEGFDIDVLRKSDKYYVANIIGI